MSAVNRRREDVLAAVLRLDRSPSELRALLAEIGWDAEQPLVTLTRRGMRNVLQRALEGRIPLAHVEPWAELIEGREDIGREVGSEAELNEALFELANPTLVGTTVGELIRRWVRRLA